MSNVVNLQQVRFDRAAESLEQLDRDMHAAITNLGFGLVRDGVSTHGGARYCLSHHGRSLVQAHDDLELFELFDLVSELLDIPERQWPAHAAAYVETMHWLHLGAEA